MIELSERAVPYSVPISGLSSVRNHSPTDFASALMVANGANYVSEICQFSSRNCPVKPHALVQTLKINENMKSRRRKVLEVISNCMTERDDSRNLKTETNTTHYGAETTRQSSQLPKENAASFGLSNNLTFTANDSRNHTSSTQPS